MQSAFLIPVKAFHHAKRRLRGNIPDLDRIRLARGTAQAVLSAIGEAPAYVACDDQTVAEWAAERGAAVLWGPGLGLNGAIEAGVAEIAARGHDHVTIAHGDLPLPGALARVPIADTIVLVPDRHGTGTNVCSRPVTAPVAAMYGPNSFDAHLAAAFASGYPVSVRRDAQLAFDIDTIEDCQHPMVAPFVRSLLGHTGLGEL